MHILNNFSAPGRYALSLLIFSFLTLFIVAAAAQSNEPIRTSHELAHPRILLLENEETAIQENVASNAKWKKMHEAILSECEAIIEEPPVERIKIGRRLLSKSRECLRRVFYLSYAWRMTQEEKYFLRAEKEMLAVAGFSDWNPSHFLDVAEMTMGLAIGYDWLYDKLSESSKETIREAIVKKGIEPSFDDDYNWFLTATHNWNQVCNAGMTYGALAVAEDYPELAKKTIDRAVETIHLPMEDYKPNGAYPEGYSYWGYGTSFNVMFLSVIEKAFDSDYGLAETAGFLKTAGFLENMTGTTGLCYNWGDCGLGGSISPAMFWFAQKNNDPSLLWVEDTYLQKEDYSAFTRNRLLPAIMIWGKDIQLEDIKEPIRKVWVGQGANPVSLMRTSWTDPNGIYLGFKAGSASVNHGHMDIGSFIMEADGVRWAMDFGSQDYHSLESKGIQVFGRTQDAQRWSIFRLNNYVHNTLTIDNQLQQVKGYAAIDRHSDSPDFPFAISDISTVYDGQLRKATRGVGIKDEQHVVIRDELEALDKATTVRWTMLTPADVVITGENGATLSKDGKKLFMQVQAPLKVTMKTWSTQSTTDYDAPNPGTIMVGFECEIPANSTTSFQVLLIPEKASGAVSSVNKSLEAW